MIFSFMSSCRSMDRPMLRYIPCNNSSFPSVTSYAAAPSSPCRGTKCFLPFLLVLSSFLLFWSLCLNYHLQNKIKYKYVQNDDKTNKFNKYGGFKICLFSILSGDLKTWFWMEFDRFDPKLIFKKLWLKLWFSWNLIP